MFPFPHLQAQQQTRRRGGFGEGEVGTLKSDRLRLESAIRPLQLWNTSRSFHLKYGETDAPSGLAGAAEMLCLGLFTY